MSKRNDRREAEREARKANYQQLRQQRAQSALIAESAAAEPVISEAELAANQANDQLIEPLISEAQLTANRANAQLSTGPVTDKGKAKSAQNSLKHGLTSATVLLPTDNLAEYERRLASCRRAYNPVGDEEDQLVQTMVDTQWRLHRSRILQMGIMYKGQLEFAAQFADQTPARREILIEVQTYLKYEKSIRNLQMHEARLCRRYEKDVAELTRIQQARKSEERQAAKANRPSPTPNRPNGFDFSKLEAPPANLAELDLKHMPDKAQSAAYLSV